MNLPNMKIPTDKFYKAVFVIGAIVTITSLFIPTIDISNHKVQIAGLIGMSYSIVAWLLDNKFSAFMRHTIFSDIKLDYAQQNAISQTIILVIFGYFFYAYVLA